MTLIACVECGNQVSDIAAACPKCGAPVAKPAATSSGGGLFAILKWVVIAFVVLAVWSSFVKQTEKTSQGDPVRSLEVPSSGNEANDRLAALSPMQRNDMLGKLMAASGEACGEVRETFYQGMDADRRAYWDIRCFTGESYAVQVSANSAGSTRITNCKALNLVGAKCWTRF